MTSPRRLLTELGLAAHKGRSQNFLNDPGTAALIVGRAGLTPETVALEIGPGLGALTGPLLDTGARVTAVEIDRGLAGYVEQEFSPRYPGRLTVLNQDILRVDFRAIAGGEEGKLTVVGNLPYHISTPVLLGLVDNRQLVDRAVLMFQTELADRLAARPGTKAYGRLSVILSYYARVEHLLEVGPASFYPRPKVGSTVLGVSFKERPEPPLDSPGLFRQVVAAGFSRRRKTLKNALGSSFPPDRVAEALAAAGIEPTRRAETLSPEEFVHLTNAWPV